jgi:hypothetical protein
MLQQKVVSRQSIGHAITVSGQVICHVCSSQITPHPCLSPCFSLFP